MTPVGFGFIGSGSVLLSFSGSVVLFSEYIGFGRTDLLGCDVTGDCGINGHWDFLLSLIFSPISKRVFVLIFESDCVFRIDRVTGRASFAVAGRELLRDEAVAIFFSVMRFAVARPDGRHGGRDLSLSLASFAFFSR